MRFNLRSALAASGFALLVGSLIWWQSLPERTSPNESSKQPLTAEGLGPVIIDPGHGGQDSGKMQNGILEKDLALDVARRVERILVSKGVATLLTRSGDNYVSLAGRAAIANRERDAVFVSIHFDDAKASATGVETYYAARQVADMPLLASWLPFLQPAPSDFTNVQSQSLAGCVQEALVTRTHAINRGTRAGQFYVISNVRHPAVLVEGGFLSNKDELAKIVTDDYREQLATAIAEGVMRFRDFLRTRARPLPPSA